MQRIGNKSNENKDIGALALDDHKKDDFNFTPSAIVAKKQELIQLCKDKFSTMTNYFHDFLQFSYFFA